jgi:hypothetical protein
MEVFTSSDSVPVRYYYAIIEFDTIEAAEHAFNELEGTELERSANVFDLSYVPDDMGFDDDPRLVILICLSVYFDSISY